MLSDVMAPDNGGNPDQPICDLAGACRLLFCQILHFRENGAPAVQERLSLLFGSKSTETPALDLLDINDEYGQFSVWSKNLGVFASDNSSLDYRLREAPEARVGIVSLLCNLRGDLTECLSLIRKDRVFDQNASSDFPSDSDSDVSMNSEDGMADATHLTKFELQNRFNNISEVVNNLIKLAEIIRSSGSQNRNSRAVRYEHVADGVNHTLAFENDYLPLVLKHRFKLEAPLQERFRKAIAFRRRRFLYQAKHQKRLAYGNDAQFEEPAAPVPKQQAKPMTHRATHAPAIRRTVPAKRSVDNGTEAPTQATTFRIVARPKAPSTIVSASSKFDSSGVDLPPPPPIPTAKATHFECPYCCVLVPVAKHEKRRWRQHVIADLQPFICIEPDCPTPDVMLESQNDWVEHQRWEHAMHWWCEGDGANHPALHFNTEAAFLAHCSESHTTLVSSDAVKRRAHMASHPSLMPFNCCPFCDFLPAGFATLCIDKPDTVLRVAVSQKALQEHLTQELLNIFLIALPERIDLEDDFAGTDTERSPGNRSTIHDVLADEEIPEFDLDDSPPSLSMIDHAIDEDVIDPEIADSIWATVWASPQLRKSVRESYAGPALDANIKHLALRQDQQDNLESAQLEYGVWIPGISVNNEKLFSPRLVPSFYTGTITGRHTVTPISSLGDAPGTLGPRIGLCLDVDKSNLNCICAHDDIYDNGIVVNCKSCGMWQHVVCYYPIGKPPEDHCCVRCKPQQVLPSVEKARERQSRRLFLYHYTENALTRPTVPSTVPHSPLRELQGLCHKFYTEWFILCENFILDPPSDSLMREKKHRHLSESILSQVLLKADAVELGVYEGAREYRKLLTVEVIDTLGRLDAAMQRSSESHE